MSPPPVALSPDLKRLCGEGYNVGFVAGHLVVRDVPYLDANRKVRWGALVSELSLAGDRTVRPRTHIVEFTGDYPCQLDGSRISQIQHNSKRRVIDSELAVQHSFSNKPNGKPPEDYYEKMTNYINIICAPAQAVDPDSTPCTWACAPAPPESVFNYLENASSRVGITAAQQKLADHRVGLVGLGGTGSYVLDFLTKTPLGLLRIVDGDDFVQHNAFRSPGAASLELLKSRPKKVDYFQTIYSAMHRRIEVHTEYLTEENTSVLDDLDFLFLCVDNGEARKFIAQAAEARALPFVDVGMGVSLNGDSLLGQLRTTLSTTEDRAAFRKHAPLAEAEVDDEYSTNIQVVELNAMNAAYAVMAWKKHLGFYCDVGQPRHVVHSIEGNYIATDEDS